MMRVILGFIILCGVLVSGCAGAFATPDLHVTVTDSSTDWTVSQGFVYDISFYVSNQGDITTVKNVVVHFDLIDKQTGKIRDYQDVYVGTMTGSTTNTFQVRLDGDMGHSYSYQYKLNYG
jgi:hypothetical protein